MKGWRDAIEFVVKSEKVVTAKRAKNSLLKNSVFSFLLNVSATAISFFAIPITLRIMGLQNYGSFVFVQAAAAIVFTLTTLQYWQGLLVEFPGKASSAQLLKRHVLRSLSFEVVGIVAAFAVILVLSQLSFGQISVFKWTDLLLIILSTLLPTLGSLVAFYRLTDRYQTLMVVGLACNILRLVFLNIAWHVHPTVSAVILSYAAPEILRSGYLGCSLFFRKSTEPVAEDGPELQQGKIYSAGKWSTAQAVADLPVAHVDKILVGLALSPEALGIYNILKRLYSIINMATAPVYMNSIPEFARKVNRDDVAGAYKLWRKTILMLMPVSAFIGVVFFATRDIWTGFVYHGLVNYSSELFVVILTAVIAGSFITSHAFYWALGKKRQTTVITVTSNIIYLGLLLLLSAKFQLIGALIAFLIHVVAVVLVKVFFLLKEKGAYV